MNIVMLIGRTAMEPDIRYTGSGFCTARFTLAVDRDKKKDEEKKADFLNIVCLGKTAEFIEKYIVKGQKIAVQGKIQTGSYERSDGTKVYKTDIIAEKIEVCQWKEKHTEDGFIPSDENDNDYPF